MDSEDEDTHWFQQQMLEQQRREEEALAQQHRIEDLKITTLTDMYRWIDSTRDPQCKA